MRRIHHKLIKISVKIIKMKCLGAEQYDIANYEHIILIFFISITSNTFIHLNTVKMIIPDY